MMMQKLSSCWSDPFAVKFQSVSVATGQEALVKAKRYQPRLVIMDIMHPEMDGAEAVLAIKKQGLVQVPVIFLSGIAGQQENSGTTSTVKFGKETCVAFSKPFAIPEFLTAVRAAQ
jgi:CheY-like chemotaxis protein